MLIFGRDDVGKSGNANIVRAAAREDKSVNNDRLKPLDDQVTLLVLYDEDLMAVERTFEGKVMPINPWIDKEAPLREILNPPSGCREMRNKPVLIKNHQLKEKNNALCKAKKALV